MERKDGFSLVEILVVMTIITILSGMMYAGFGVVMRTVRKAEAENVGRQVGLAVSSFHTDYHRYPKPEGGDERDGYVDYATDVNFLSVLTGADTEAAKKQNPKLNVYFQGKTAKRLDSDTYVNGILFTDDSSGAGSLWDPWGRMYGVRIDRTNKERMPNPAITMPILTGQGAPQWGTGSEAGQRIIAESVAVWSSGRDEETAGDNVGTW